jgi:FAD-dependent oxidoreductase domain-containing protein 1
MLTRQVVKLWRSYPRILKNCENRDKSCVRNQTINLLKRNYSSDVVVIGGGAMGASVAYWLKDKTVGSKKDLRVVVIEKDPTYSCCSTSLSVGGIRQQFSVPENIQMSLFGASFIKNIKSKFGPEADISFMPNGYLILASENGAQQLSNNFKLQQQLGATNRLFTKQQLKKRFAWLNVDDIELGCCGGENEGWFDPWGLLSLLRSGASSKGAEFIQGEAVDFVFGANGELRGVVVKLPNNEQKTISFEHCVITAGAESGKIAKLARIGSDDLSTPLPVEKRKRYVYRFDSQGDNPPEINSPLMIDYTGVYFRRDGGSYIGGLSPKPEEEPETNNLDVDFDFFDNRVWPLLAHRIPAFQSVKVCVGNSLNRWK